MRVTVIGTGYVGTVTGVCLAYLGHRVTCVDTDESKIARCETMTSRSTNPALNELLPWPSGRAESISPRSLRRPCSESDVIFIAVGTPPLPTGEANLRYLEAAARSIGAAMDASRFRVVVNKSTVPVGCGNLVETLVREGIRERTCGKSARSVSAWPAIRNSCAKAPRSHDSLYPDRIVVGRGRRADD